MKQSTPEAITANVRSLAPPRNPRTKPKKQPYDGGVELETHIAINLDQLPGKIGCHAPNKTIHLDQDDAPGVLNWVLEKIDRSAGTTGTVIVDIVSWCPAWLMGQLAAALVLDKRVHELRYFTGLNFQHNIFDKNGILGVIQFTGEEADT